MKELGEGWPSRLMLLLQQWRLLLGQQFCYSPHISIRILFLLIHFSVHLFWHHVADAVREDGKQNTV